MKNKNTVVALLIIFTTICAYNLYWTYVQYSKDAELTEKRSLYDEVKARQLEGETLSDTDSSAIRDYEALMEDEDFQETYNKAIENSFTF